MARNGKRWALGFGAAAVIVGGTGLILFTTVWTNLDAGNKVAGIVSALAALVSSALALVTTLSQKQSGSNESSSAAVVGQLADQVRALSVQEEEHRRIGDPHPLSVQWQSASKELADWENVEAPAERTRSKPVVLTGGFTNIRETYAAVPSGRLLILGRAGAGKTALAHRLIIALLDEPDRAEPVPVLFSLSDWDPTALALRDWLVHQLVRDFPFLDAREPAGKSTAQLLVETDRILPVLDGFDEIPERHHHDAIDGISRLRGPLVVTSRPDEYADAAQAARALSRATAIELADLPLEEARRYLLTSTNKTRTAAWDVVFDRLTTAPDEPSNHNLTPVLTTPLMVTLARATYNDSQERDPRELLDTTRFPTRAALEEHLLDATLNALYDPRHTSERPGGAVPPPCEPDRVRHWLGHLAAHLTKRDTHDLTWWQLPSTLLRRTRVLVTAATLGLVGGFTYWFVGELAMKLGLSLSSGLVGGGASRLANGLFAGLVAGLAAGIINERPFSHRGAGHEPERLQLRLPRRDRTQHSLYTDLKRSAFEFTFGLTTGTAAGFAVSLSYGFVVGLKDGFVVGIQEGIRVGSASGLRIGVTIGLVVGLVNIVVSLFGDTPRGAISPWQLLTIDRTVALVRTILTAVAILLAVGLANALEDVLKYVYTDPLSDGLMFGIVFGMVRLVRSAWGQWLLFARLWLPLTRRLPWRPKRFLEDAYRRGVLRQAGAIYQLRHAQLRDHLAKQYRDHRKRNPAETAAGGENLRSVAKPR